MAKRKYGYEDMLHLPHHESVNRGRMPREDRAAQFAPFAALTGYDEAVKETGRWTEAEVELEEDQKAFLDSVLRDIQQREEEHPMVEITYFRPDAKKIGGVYETAEGAIELVDLKNRTIVMMDQTRIPMDRIRKIKK